MNEKTRVFIFILALAFTVIPAMIVSGFFPAWQGLSFLTWVLIAAIGTGILFGFLTPVWYKGFVSGIVLSLGILYGVYYYILLRTELTDSTNILRIEIILAVLIGAIPGTILSFIWGIKR